MLNIGLLLIATNKYYEYALDLIHSADKHFLPQHNVSYFLFTNRDCPTNLTTRKIVYTPIEHKPWPWMTLGRYHIFSQYKYLFKDMNYLFYCDADMRFVGDVGEEILSELVATQHPGYCGTRGTPETNTASLAYIPPDQPMQYFAGGFNGGSADHYLSMAKELSINIDKDYHNNIIAIWHDESHINKYFTNNLPSKILPPHYCHPEYYSLSDQTKIIALLKEHTKCRQ